MGSMELSQMTVQALVQNASPLLQLPHFSTATVEKAKAVGVEDIFDLMNMEDKPRADVLGKLTEQQQNDVARACNRYPCITLAYKVSNEDQLHAGGVARVNVKLERDVVDEGSLGPVIAPYYPKEKEESWWLVVGSEKDKQLLAIKRITLNAASKPVVNVKLDVELPAEAGKKSCTLYFMSDSYNGCDQEYKFDLKVKA